MKKRVKKKIVWQKYIIMSLFTLMGAIGGMFIAKEFDTKNMPLGELLIVFGIGIMGLFIVIFLQIIIHEAGHLIFGIISGYGFSSFRIGNLMWVKDAETIRFKRMTIAGTGGQCLMNPPEMVNGGMPFFLYNLGGPIMNIVSSAIFLGGYAMFNNYSFTSVFFLMLSIVGFIFAIMNGIPMRMGIVDNDGYNAFSLGKNKDALRSFWVQLKVGQELSKGRRLRDLPNEWFFVPSNEGMKNSTTAVMGVFYANRLLDFHNFNETVSLIDKLFDMDTAIVGLHRSLLVCDKIYCKLLNLDDTEKIIKMLDKNQKQFMNQMKKFPSVLRTQYAIALLLENDINNANRIYKEFEKYSLKHPYHGDIESEFELIKKAEQVFLKQNQ